MSSAVLLTAFGGPDRAEAVGPFMARLMGREPEERLVDAVTARYRAIGGCSPLPAIAESVASLLAEELRSRGHDVAVRVGMRYWHPLIGESVDALAAGGADRLVTVSLSPFESKVSSVAYREAVMEAKARRPGLSVAEAPMLHRAPAFTAALEEAAARAVDAAAAAGRALALFTAHSLPLDDLLSDDPYVREVRATAEEVAGRLGLGADDTGEVALGGTSAWGDLRGERPWIVAYQSKGRRPGAWLGPDLEDMLEAAAEAGFEAVAVCPVGFATDHMETVYDLDVSAAERARDLGLAFERAEAPNDRPLLIEALRSLVEPLL
ncbi:MAG: ferrochelatase [Coriobacteriia bacterium]|nr:ferrochelatase [Coriobacteriia bacterium]